MYYFEEIDVDKDAYDKVIISSPEDSSISPNEVNITNNTPAKYMENQKEKEFEVGKNSKILFQNHAKGNKLTIKKVLKGDSTTHTNAIKIELKNANGEFVTYKGKYNLNNAESEVYQEECIVVKQDDVIEISGVPKNTIFKVTEVNIKDNNNSVTSHYAKPVYKDEGENTFYIEEGWGWNTVVTGEPWILTSAKGKMSGTNASILIENKLLIGKITINKSIDEANFINGDPIFTFHVKNTNTGVVYTKTVRFSETGSKTEKVVFNNLPCGQYKVTEKDTLRYEINELIPNQGSIIVESDKSATVNLVGTTCDAIMTFKNARNYSNNFSHTDQLINNFSIDENGNVTAYSQVDNMSTIN